jgi:hypothetical protein
MSPEQIGIVVKAAEKILSESSVINTILGFLPGLGWCRSRLVWGISTV